MDRDNKSFISLSDLKNYFNEKRINYTEFNIRELIRHFDKDADFVLNFEE